MTRLILDIKYDLFVLVDYCVVRFAACMSLKSSEGMFRSAVSVRLQAMGISTFHRRVMCLKLIISNIFNYISLQ